MKKITLLLAAAFTTVVSFAQEVDTNTGYDLEDSTIYGVNVGGNTSVIKMDDPGYKTSAGTSFTVGFSGEIGLSEDLSFFGHINYDRRVYSLDYTYIYGGDDSEVISEKTESTQTANFISIPLGIRFYMGENRNLFINAGGSVDLFLSGKAKVENGDSYNYGLSDSGYKDASFSLFPGLGYRLPLSKENGDDLLFEVKYYIGLTDTYYGLSSKMNSAQLSVSYRIDWTDM